MVDRAWEAFDLLTHGGRRKANEADDAEIEATIKTAVEMAVEDVGLAFMSHDRKFRVLVIPSALPHEVRLVAVKDDDDLRGWVDVAIADGHTDTAELDQRMTDLTEEHRTDFEGDPSLLLYEVHGLINLATPKGPGCKMMSGIETEKEERQ